MRCVFKWHDFEWSDDREHRVCMRCGRHEVPFTASAFTVWVEAGKFPALQAEAAGRRERANAAARGVG